MDHDRSGRGRGHIKLARANLSRFFSFGGYGSDSAGRGELTRKAIDRVRDPRLAARPAARSRVGDSPNDIAAAHAAHAVGVASRAVNYSQEELREAGADYVLGFLEEDLPGTAEGSGVS